MSDQAAVYPSDRLLAVARGDQPADVVVRGERVVNLFTGEVAPASIAVCDGRVAGVSWGDVNGYEGAEVVEAGSGVVAPGFIDAHMHIESTMMRPTEFGRLAAAHGTVGVVADPHEIANVLGGAGVRYMMEDARHAPLEVMWAVSSCVPASGLETSGARLEVEDLRPLMEEPGVVALAEMMNFPGVVAGDARVLEKVRLGLSRWVVDGHAPGLSGTKLAAYVAAGIGSDHECTTAAEASEKLGAGMRVFIREGSAARNLTALLPAVNAGNKHRFCFCTDDRHPGDLDAEGHIDHVVRRAIAEGLNPVWAIAMGSLHVAEHYRRPDLGAIAPGRWANLVVLSDLKDVRARMVMYRGRVVARDGVCIGPEAATGGRARPPESGVRLPKGLGERSFKVVMKRPTAGRIARMRVIRMIPGQIVTGAEVVEVRVGAAGEVGADVPTDLAKLAVIERHRRTGNIGLGFVRGFGLQRGAIASTVGHDSHNLAVLGMNDADMLLAARTLEACGGGQCVVRDGKVLAVLELRVAGLMSDQSGAEVVRGQRALLDAARMLGGVCEDPFMPLSFLSLPVIPKLKLTDLGLVDVERFAVVPLEVV